jgi:hypothetical protein
MSEHENPAPAGFSASGVAEVKEVEEVKEVGEVKEAGSLPQLNTQNS